MFSREQGVGDETVLRFTGVLDSETASDVAGFLRPQPSDAPARIVIHFDCHSRISYYGLVLLLKTVVQSGARVTLRGLANEHVRLVRYFGLNPGDFGITESPEAGEELRT